MADEKLMGPLEQLEALLGSDDEELLETLISRGKADLSDLAGLELDFEVEGLPRSLLIDYCRYAYHNATEFFEENFARQILRMQLQAAIAEANDDTE